jgi:hypothetical protein
MFVTLVCIFVTLVCIFVSLVCIFVTSCVFFVTSFVFVALCVYCCLTYLVAELLAISQYSEGPATGHLDTGFSCFPCAYKQMLRWIPRLQVATACFSRSPPDLNFLDPYFTFMFLYFIFMYMHNYHWHQVTAHLQSNILLLSLLLLHIHNTHT